LDKLKLFIEDRDQNLRYLGLLGLKKIMNQQPKSVAQHRETILSCLEDNDITIRMRALDLITSMVTKRNLQSIVSRLQEHLSNAEGNYKEHIMEQIIQVCKQSNYGLIEDFTWYIRLLASLIHEPQINAANAKLISDQLIDVTVRVPGIRDFAVGEMERLFLEGRVSEIHSSQGSSLARILYAAGYIVGEFSEHITDYVRITQALLQWQGVSSAGSSTHSEQAPYLQSGLKVVLRGLASYDEETWDSVDDWKNFAQQLLDVSLPALNDFSESNDLEVQERACSYLFLLNWVNEQLASDVDMTLEICEACQEVFDTPLIPVDPVAQKSVPLPKGIDLDDWIHEPPQEDDDDDEEEEEDDDYPDTVMNSIFDDLPSEGKDSDDDESESTEDKPVEKKKTKRQKKAELKKKLEEQRVAREQGPYYIKDSNEAEIEEEEISKIPVATIEFPSSFGIPKKKKKSKDKKRMQVLTQVEGLNGAQKMKKRRKIPDQVVEYDDPLAEDMNLSAPLGADEVVPTIEAYKMVTAEDVLREQRKKEKLEKKKAKKEKKEKKKKRKRSKKSKGGEEESDQEESEKEEESGEKEKEKSSNNDVDLFGLTSLGFAPKVETSTNVSSSTPVSTGGGIDALDIFNLGTPTSTTTTEKKSKKPVAVEKNTSVIESSSDDPMQIKFDYRCSRSDQNVINCLVSFKNTSDHTLKGVSLVVNGGKNVKPGKKKILLTKKLKAGSKGKAKLKLKCKESFYSSETLQYTIKSKDGTSLSGDTTVPITCMLIKSEEEMTLENLREYLEDGESCPKKSSSTLSGIDFNSVLDTLEELGFQMVHKTSKKHTTATLYAAYSGGRHLAMLMKKVDGGVKLDLKSNSTALSKGILNEISGSMETAL